jgi:hopanoid C-3 methylase
MRALFVHPGPLLYTRVFLRLEPLGLELVAEAARRAGHSVRLIDLQVEEHGDYHSLITEWRPDFIAFSCNYLANVPEIVDLAKKTKTALPGSFICIGGHSSSFMARDLLSHGEGAIDCVLKGEGEAGITALMEAVKDDRAAIAEVPGVVAANGAGPPPRLIENLDDCVPGRSSVTGANTSSAFLIQRRRSNSRAAALGIARSAAPGRSMAEATD